MKYYTVRFLDVLGYEMTNEPDLEGLKEAKDYARFLLRDPEYVTDAHKVEVLDKYGVIVWDTHAMPDALERT